MNTPAGCAVVSGGARGIGLAIAERIVAESGSVLIGDVDVERGRAVAARLGPTCAFAEWDVTDEADTVRVFDEAAERFGPVDRVFANAGFVGVTGIIQDTSLADWRHTIDVLLTGAFLTVKAAVAHMRPLGRGSIVVTASVASQRGGLGPHAYTAAKSGVKGLVESVAVEISSYGLRINAVAPGGVASSLSATLVSGDPDDIDSAEQHLARQSSAGIATTADDVADAAFFLASGRARRINGAMLIIDGADAVLGSSGRAFYTDTQATER